MMYLASGDTTQTSTVLWTKINGVGEVRFEYSTDPHFHTIAGTQIITITNPLIPGKVNISGLQPNTEYYYRVVSAGRTTMGSFETSAGLGTFDGLRFGATGDWRGALAPYPAINNAVERNLEFMVELGDTIYADYPSPAVLNEDGSRKQQVETLDEYRLKHQEVYASHFGVNSWGNLRASTSILATIDDHEVINDFSGGEPALKDSRFPETEGLINDTALYENGLTAFQEYNPLRDELYGNTGEETTAFERKLYRRNTYGSDAITIILDNRSFRDQPLDPVENIINPIEVNRFLTESLTLDRTMLGKVQLSDLKSHLFAAQANGITWKFVIVPEPIQNLGAWGASDRFEGYARERTEILSFIEEKEISNVVFIAADIHGTVINNLTYQAVPEGEQIATSAFEITTGAVAFNPPFGQTLIQKVENFGLLAPSQLALYNSLPIDNDADDLLDDKDDFLKQILNENLAYFGYDPIGLEATLPRAEGTIDATLLQGDYLAVHTFGWTEFEIDPVTQQLRVTTYGIEPYTEEELLANPESIIERQPFVVSEFIVNPQNFYSVQLHEKMSRLEPKLLESSLELDSNQNILVTDWQWERLPGELVILILLALASRRLLRLAWANRGSVAQRS